MSYILDNLHNLSKFSGILTLFVFGIAVIMNGCNNIFESYDNNPNLKKTYNRIFKSLIIILLLSSIIYVITPSKNQINNSDITIEEMKK